MRGSGLPAKTIALTFDDGPGARTVELSHYLKDQGVRAGFFVMGKNVQSRPDCTCAGWMMALTAERLMAIRPAPPGRTA